MLNQYSAINGAARGYDQRGNMTVNGVWTYAYDTENRLISASAGSKTVSFAYDAMGRRLRKTVTRDGAVTTSTAWLSIGDQEMAEYEGTGPISVKDRYVYGTGIDEPVAQINQSDIRRYYFADALGSTIALANPAGQVTEKHV